MYVLEQKLENITFFSSENNHFYSREILLYIARACFRNESKSILNIPSKKSSAQVSFRVNSVLTRDGCIKCYILLFIEIIFKHVDVFQTEI